MSEDNKRIALLPGSYDPITTGHLDIIKRTAAIFDEVVVLVSHNASKNYLLTKSQRFTLVSDAIKEIQNVKADQYDGFLVDYIAENGHPVLVKGIRNDKDLAYENEMAYYNRELSVRKYGFIAETIYLPSDGKYEKVSSTLVRTLLGCGADISDFVPNAPMLLSFFK